MTRKTKGRDHQRGATPQTDTPMILESSPGQGAYALGKPSRINRQPKRTWQRGRRA